MSLTDAQLGRIARAAAGPLRLRLLRETAALAVARSVDGELDTAIQRLDNTIKAREAYGTGLPALLKVLRDVSEEVADAKAHADRQCTVTAWDHEGGRLGTTTIDGWRVLDEVAARMRRPGAVGRITITNEAHDVCWTWEAER